MAVGVVVQTALELPEVRVDGRVGAFAHHHDLRAAPQAIIDGVLDQVDALLAVDPTDVGDDGLEVLAEPEAVAQALFASVFSIERLGRIPLRDEAVNLGIPDIVVDAVEHSAKLSTVNLERLLQTHRLL